MELLTDLYNKKLRTTLQFFLRPTMFKYHRDSIGEISIQYFFENYYFLF